MLWGLHTLATVLSSCLSPTDGERQQWSAVTVLCVRAVVHKHPMRAREAIRCVMITGCCSSHSHRQHDRQMEVDFEGWNIWRKCCELRWDYRRAHAVSIDPKQQRVDTDMHFITHFQIVLCWLKQGGAALTEAHQILLMCVAKRWTSASRTRCGHLPV